MFSANPRITVGSIILTILIQTRRYGPLRGPTFRDHYAVLVHFGNFLCPVVTLVIFSSNISNFEMNPKEIQKKIQNSPKFPKNPLQTQKIQILSKMVKKSKNLEKKSQKTVFFSTKIFLEKKWPKKCHSLCFANFGD